MKPAPAPQLTWDEPPVQVSRWTRTASWFTGAAVAAVLVLIAVPYLWGGPAEQPLVTLLTFVAMANLWNLLAGFSGLTSFGQHAYLGVGAYALYLVAAHGVNPLAGIVCAALIAALVSLPVSLLVLRLSGGYFAVATLVIAAVFQIAVTLSPSLGGTTGVSVPGLAGYEPVLREALVYWATLAVAVLSVAGVYLLVRRVFGLDARAAGSDPVAAASAGVRVRRIRRLAYLVAAGGAGAVGAVIALQTLYVEPTSVFNIQYSVYMLFMVLIGGIGTIEGPVLGALVLFGLQESLSGYGAWYLVIVGALAVAATLVASRGLWGVAGDRLGWSLLPVGYRVRKARPLAFEDGSSLGEQPAVAIGTAPAACLAGWRVRGLRAVRGRSFPVQRQSAAPAVGHRRGQRLCGRRSGDYGLEVQGRGRCRARRDCLRCDSHPAGLDGLARSGPARGHRGGSLRQDADQARYPVQEHPGAGGCHRSQRLQPLPAADGGVRRAAGHRRPQCADRSANLVRPGVLRGVRGRLVPGWREGLAALGRAGDRVADHRVRAGRRWYGCADGGLPVPGFRLPVAVRRRARRGSRPRCRLLDEGHRLARAGHRARPASSARRQARGGAVRRAGLGRRRGVRRAVRGDQARVAGEEHHLVPARPGQREIPGGQPASRASHRADRAPRPCGGSGAADLLGSGDRRVAGDQAATRCPGRGMAAGARPVADVRARPVDAVRLLHLSGRAGDLAPGDQGGPGRQRQTRRAAPAGSGRGQGVTFTVPDRRDRSANRRTSARTRGSRWPAA